MSCFADFVNRLLADVICMMQTPAEPKHQVGPTAQAIFEAIADPIFVIDFVGDGLGPTFRYVNAAACRLLGRPREELLKLRPGSVDEISEEARDAAYERLVTEGRATFETLMIAADGTRVPMEIHASDAILDGRRVSIAVARSLVVRKEMDRNLRAAKEAAEAASRAKSEFLATMSHEIRTPLHGVIGFASLLEGVDVPEKISEALDGIRASSKLLLALIDDVLDVSRIEAGLLEIQAVPIDLASLLRQVVATFRLRAEGKGLAFSYVEASAMPERMLADPVRIEQVLGNLLNNALKFTECGSITLEVQARRTDVLDVYEVSFSVSDTGIGIAVDQLPRLFHRFSQVDGSASRRYGGSGLGLVIVKRLAELMGGKASAQSEYGRGSTFEITLQARAIDSVCGRDSSEIVLAEESCLRSFSILVAEDNTLNQKLMSRMLERLGLHATFAGNGNEVQRLARENEYRVIFMDVSMPGMSGLDATRAIRDFEQTERRAPSWIIALTAGVSEDERRACAEAGMDDFLGKPFTEVGLNASLNRIRL